MDHEIPMLHEKPVYQYFTSEIRFRVKALFEIARTATSTLDIRNIVEALTTFHGFEDIVLETVVNCIRLQNDSPLAVLRALEELTQRHALEGDPELVSVLTRLALQSTLPATRQAAISLFAAIHPKHEDERVDAAEFFEFIVFNDHDALCRLAAVMGIVSKGCEAWATSALLFSLDDVRLVRLAAILALQGANPTVSLMQALTRLIVTHHSDHQAIDYAIDTLEWLLGRGFSRSSEWDLVVARLLATVTEFCLPEHAEMLMRSHASGIYRTGTSSDRVVRELLEAFTQRQYASGAAGYLDEITTMGPAAINPLITLVGEADDRVERCMLLDLLRTTICYSGGIEAD